MMVPSQHRRTVSATPWRNVAGLWERRYRSRPLGEGQGLCEARPLGQKRLPRESMRIPLDYPGHAQLRVFGNGETCHDPSMMVGHPCCMRSSSRAARARALRVGRSGKCSWVARCPEGSVGNGHDCRKQHSIFGLTGIPLSGSPCEFNTGTQTRGHSEEEVCGPAIKKP